MIQKDNSTRNEGVSEINNYYTCQGCKNEFRSLYELKIVPDYSPVCSNRCKYKILWKWLQNLKLEDETIKKLVNELNLKEKNQNYDRKNYSFAILRHVSKNISVDELNRQGTRQE